MRDTRRFVLHVLPAIGLSLICQAGGYVRAECPRYFVEIIPGPNCQFVPSLAGAGAIAPTGEVTGIYGLCNGAGVGAVWLGTRGWNAIPLPPGASSVGPTDINSSRQLAAYIPEPSNPDVLRRAAFYDFGNSTLVDIGHLPGDNQSESHAINDSGTVCGYSVNTSTGPGRAFLWQDERLSALNLPLGPNSVAYDIADTGAVCGWMGLAPSVSGPAHAFVWLNGQTTDLGTVLKGAPSAEARGISRNGSVVCGYCVFPASPPQARAFIWHDGRADNLGLLSPSHSRSFAYAVNDSKNVVGISTDHNGGGSAFVWRSGVMTALNDLIPSALQLDIFWVGDINNAGQIAGEAVLLDGSNDHVAVRLTPIQPPPGDCDCNNVVGIHDLIIAIGQWGPAIPTTTADFDNSGVVDIHDILTVIANWD